MTDVFVIGLAALVFIAVLIYAATSHRRVGDRHSKTQRPKTLLARDGHYH